MRPATVTVANVAAAVLPISDPSAGVSGQVFSYESGLFDLSSADKVALTWEVGNVAGLVATARRGVRSRSRGRAVSLSGPLHRRRMRWRLDDHESAGRERAPIEAQPL